jgi:hypothetical protein
MPKVSQTTIPCAQCRQPVRVTIQSLIDAGQDPQAKISLLSGRLNSNVCPACGTPNNVLAPMMYHDGAKELLISYVPMELGLPKDTQEKVIGELMREVTVSLPQGAFKAYLLQPRQALTMQGLIDQVLQADGVTPEMMESQRARVRLVEQFLQAPDDLLPGLIQQHDAQIDAQFMQTMTLILQQVMAEGRQAAAGRVAEIQNQIVEGSTFGKQLMAQAQAQEETIQVVADDLNALGDHAGRPEILGLVLRYAGDEQRLQALVGLIRPLLDYQFFQDLTAEIAKAPAADRDRFEATREALLAFTSMVDQQAQAAVAEAVSLLQEILASPEPDAVIEENLLYLDNTFMQVLTANIQEATRRNDLNASSRLKDVYQRVMGALSANMPPELRFVNELLSAPNPEAARQLIGERAKEFGPGLLEAIDILGQQIQGQGSPAVLEKLAFIRGEIASSLSAW